MHELQRLDWDTSFFGVGIGSFAGTLTPPELDDARKMAELEGISCFYWFADPDDAPSAKLAQSAGFRYVDTRLTFAAPLLRGPHSDARPASSEDLPGLTQLARHSHTNTRFFFDGNFDQTRCEDLYQLWLERSFDGTIADSVLAVHLDERPAGYVTVKVREGVGQIGLIAVADFAQGRGLGKALVRGALCYAADAGATQMRVATQSRNLGAQRLYVSCGLKPDSVLDIYHWWL